MASTVEIVLTDLMSSNKILIVSIGVVHSVHRRILYVKNEECFHHIRKGFVSVSPIADHTHAIPSAFPRVIMFMNSARHKVD